MILVEKMYLPHKALTNFELEDAVYKLSIPHWRGIFMRDNLPQKPHKNECGILNLDDTNGNGTHWVAWLKKGNLKYYFDSYGIQPPLELVNYLGNDIYYSTEQIQQRGTVVCGHLCLYVLKKLSVLKRINTKSIQKVINTLY